MRILATIVGPVSNAEKIASGDKFWFLENIYNYFIDLGLSDGASNFIAFAVAVGLIFVVVWVVNKLIVELALRIIKFFTQRTTTKIDDILLDNKVFHRLVALLPITAVIFSARVLFAGFELGWIVLFEKTIETVLVVVFLRLSFALLESWNDHIRIKSLGKGKSIKGYVQLIKILLGVIAVILIVSILFDKDPSSLFVGLGATAAIFTLVFKDTILGFIASIQLSAQDMVRLGDWIEVPSSKADGMVVDININSVKVRNWDNTLTLVPIYMLVSEPFTNWREMEESDGRRFIRSFKIDVNSVKPVREKLINSLSKSPVTAERLAEIQKLSDSITTYGNEVTNLSLFRSHIELFIRSHSGVNQNLMVYVRYLTVMDHTGLGIEISCFTKDKTSVEHDKVVRSVIEYVLSTAYLFDIKFYQSISGSLNQEFKGVS